jgi:hypothetical protein
LRLQREADFVQSVVGSPRTNSILLVPSQDGSLALELALRGFTVTCAELAPYSELEELGSQSIRSGRLDLVNRGRGLLPYIDLVGRRFDVVVCFWGSLGWREDTYDMKLLSTINHALAQSGRLLVETHVVETLPTPVPPTDWALFDDYLALIRRRYFPVSQNLHLDASLVSLQEVGLLLDGSQTCNDVHVYSFAQLANMLSSTGFRIQMAMDSTDGSLFRIGSRRLALLAQKEG